MKLRTFTIIGILFIISNMHAQQVIQISNPGFEKNGGQGVPENWTSSGNVRADNSVFHSGGHSAAVVHNDFSQTEILSEPVRLVVGHLYKLSAWVKTENAETNPYDRYPTPVAACISMNSFPFTNHSEAVGATKNWTKIEVQFIATTKNDRVKLVFGNNGKARSKVWFDDVELQKEEDITQYIPFETVKWFNNAFRYDDKGWIFLHIEGKPYERGYQYGSLVPEEIAEFINKLSIQLNKDYPERGWADLRFTADATMLRKYDDEYLNEMKGIADGVNKTGVKIFKRKLDLLDIVTVNSAVDISYLKDAIRNTPNQLSGQSFLKAEDELNIDSRLHKCSSFLANNSSTTDGRILFGQLFMWGGYTGNHWNIMCDVQPSEGHRLVYETFPGGIHSGADFYINDAGIMIGETTVGQTPFNPDGSPQSNRIRKAAQYAESIDDVVKILTTNNNGMYTNDWLIGDVRANEIAVLLLGTNKYKLWRSSKNEFYGDTKDFYWCNNNNKDPEVRKEYISNQDNAPYDLIFNPWNRDLEFNKFYQEYKGKMDAVAGVNIIATSPINRPHACDGKVTTSEMAENMVFLAHYGKVTLREKFVNENGRIPDLPGAFPHLTLGYSVVSPVFIAAKLKEEKLKREKIAALTGKTEIKTDNSQSSEKYSFDERKLWINTVYPASEGDNWFVSGTANYWNILKNIPASKDDILNYFRDQLADLNCRYLYTIEREGSIAPADVKRVYTKYNNYVVPRIKGTYLLHQLRLLLGNDEFSKIMNEVHDTYREKEMSTKNFISLVNKTTGKDLSGFINQWVTRDDLPGVTASSEKEGVNKVKLTLKQNSGPYHFLCAVKINGSKQQVYKIIEVKDREASFTFDIEDPVNVEFNPLFDIPEEFKSHYTWANIFDDWKTAKIVYGTSRQIEANHTLAMRFSTALADRFTEDLIPITKDNEFREEDLKNSDLILIGSVEDNSLLKKISGELGFRFGKNIFSWHNRDYSRPDEGIFLTVPNPYNPMKVIYIFNSNSALELYQMTKIVNTMPQWAVYRCDKIVEKGYFNK